MEMRDNRLEMFPKEKKDLPRTDPDLDSKEFKQVLDPNAVKRKKKVDSVTKSCLDLGIDG
jgi:hypothetical protein